MTNAEIEEALAPFPQVEAPKRLMKFFSPAGLPLLAQGTLKVTPPSDFNDPFEFFPAIPDAPTKDDLRAWFLNPDSFLRAARGQKKHDSDYEHWVETIGLTHLECWQEALQSIATGYMKAVSAAYGVSCFMDRNHDDLKKPEIVHFWDRYAGSHTGFAVGFDPSVGLLRKIHGDKFLFPAASDDKPRLEITPEKPTMNDKVLLAFLREIGERKDATWAAEREWRLIAPFRAESYQGLVTSQLVGERIIYLLNLWKDQSDAGQEICEIYLGFRASEDLKKTVLRFCHEPRLKHVAVFQTAICPHSYEFAYRQVK